MTISKFMLKLAGHSRGREERLARASRAEESRMLRNEFAADERQFRAQSAELARRAHVTLGESATGVPYRISLDELTRLPSWITAGTGAGKSRFVGAMMATVLAQIAAGEPVSIVEIEGKGEGADMFLRAIASTAASMSGRAGEDFLSRVHVLRFFDNMFLPSWPLLQRMQGVPVEVQADAVAEVLTDVAEDALIGPRQRSMLAAVLAIAIEFDVPMAALPWLLSSPSEVAALAARSTLPSVRLELSRFEREPQGSIDGLIARLGILLRVPSLKAVLSGPRPFDFSLCFEPGHVSVLDFGGADLGARAAVRAIGSLAISSLANAAFNPRRDVRGPTMIAIDEPQALMTGVTLGQIERLITLGRSFGAGGICLLHQGATQLPMELQSILNTNVVLRALGRSSERDALAASEWLPRTGRVPRRREPGGRGAASTFFSEGEEQRLRVAEIGRLPTRHFLVADRRANFSARIVQAPEYDPPAWREIDPEIAAAVRRGSAGFARADLERRVADIEAQAVAALEERLTSEPAAAGRRGRAGRGTPDIVGERRRRGGAGGVP